LTERVYRGFKAQGSTRTGGFSDVPFEPPAEGVDASDFYDAKHMSDYLDDYVDSHVYAGKTIRDRIEFNTKVEKIEKVNGAWIIHGSTASGSLAVYAAPKVIVASGRTSTPNEPRLLGKESFKGQIVHTMDYGRSKILEEPKVEKVSVLGAGKSAADMVYQAVKAGKSVNWIIRVSGKGPGKFIDGRGKAWCRNIVELGHVRTLAALLDISALSPPSLWSWFIGKTSIGRRLLAKVFNSISQQAAADADYDRRPGARESFKLLKNDTR
jgi:dimethylaniline monooxygenase (N-oxide forming)